MKKWLALCLAVLMLLTVTACGGDEDFRGTITGGDNSADVDNSSGNEESSASDSDEEAFSFGNASGGTYENAYIGIGCTLSSDWTFSTDEQIREMNNMTMDMVDEETASMLESANVIYDMMAVHSNQMDNVGVTLEKSTALQVAATDLKEMLENSLPQLETALSSMGCTNISSSVVEVEIDEEKFSAAKITSEFNGVSMYQLSVSMKCGKYIAAVTITTMMEDTTQDILDSFYLVD